ncbi:MAG: sodium/proline symporter PutP [Blautia sp.]|nr:sodium/proline symporter PutP [Blautia sp.]
MSTTNIIILVAFALYLAMMVIIGALYMRTTASSEDYFLGGRGLNGWVAALSAQASDMSGWLLMGLPGAVYSFGTGQIWIAVGLFIGTVANWIIVSGPLRKYTYVANNSLTLPEFFGNRYRDKKKILLFVSSIMIVIFFLVYTASALAAGGKLFNTVFGLDYHLALAIGAAVILAYTLMGGFMAVCTTDFIQGTLMLVGLLVVPIIAYFMLPDGSSVSQLLNESGAAGGAASFLNPLEDGGSRITFISIISQLAWGLGYCGMPHILVRFMAIRDEKELKKSRWIAIIWDILSLGAACFIGVIGRCYLLPVILGETEGAASSESVFIEMIRRLFTESLALPFIGGIFLCGILAAIMSTADSQLLVTASAVSEDLYHSFIDKNADSKKVLNVSRITVLVVAVLAFVIAWNPDSSIMGLVSNAWAGLGSAFGPIVMMSLFWKRTNLPGAIAGIVSGGGMVILWDYIPLLNGQTLGAATGLYSLVVGFAFSILMIIIVSLCTKAPSKEITDEFDKVKNMKRLS